ncbi:putative fluoride ion transporter CrcB [Streptomyces sp. RB5]|uniref:Fluoride-specific ion channel FluC n=1 Tax=Streptomyces smaragdinus TaxID=2585196 RepID=A0A7K0CMW7_9ACTN|nr:CrcB family protein [Streptomyces smaragdinus]MQY14613.1 putative fluoride ion transporter CrcB [Streptomyces smaragdinus]
MVTDDGVRPGGGHVEEPIDPDVDLHLPSNRAETAGFGLEKVLGVIALGGVLGALGRYGVTLLWTTPWAVLCVNVVGCGLIGVLMVLVSEMGTAHPLVRPFLGTGVLGGFTTFSTYSVGFAEFLWDGRPVAGLGYAFGTLAGAMCAVWAAATVTRRVVAR